MDYTVYWDVIKLEIPVVPGILSNRITCADLFTLYKYIREEILGKYTNVGYAVVGYVESDGNVVAHFVGINKKAIVSWCDEDGTEDILTGR